MYIYIYILKGSCILPLSDVMLRMSQSFPTQATKYPFVYKKVD